jgi:hypothetical protein
MDDKFIFFENIRPKLSNRTARPMSSKTVERLDSEVRQSRCQSLANLVQQSRALYRTNAAKVKRQKENGLWGHCPILAFALVPRANV